MVIIAMQSQPRHQHVSVYCEFDRYVHTVLHIYSYLHTFAVVQASDLREK